MLLWWRHDIKWKQFLSHWPFVRGIHRPPVDSPHKGQWRGACFDVLLDQHLNKWLSKQSRRRLFEMSSHSLWRHCNVDWKSSHESVTWPVATCMELYRCCEQPMANLEVGAFYPTLQWRHNGHDGVSNHRRLDCLLNRLFRRSSKKTSKLLVTGLCEGNSPVTGEFPAQKASNTENVFIWWRLHAFQFSWYNESQKTTWMSPFQGNLNRYSIARS